MYILWELYNGYIMLDKIEHEHWSQNCIKFFNMCFADQDVMAEAFNTRGSLLVNRQIVDFTSETIGEALNAIDCGDQSIYSIKDPDRYDNLLREMGIDTSDMSTVDKLKYEAATFYALRYAGHHEYFSIRQLELLEVPYDHPDYDKAAKDMENVITMSNTYQENFYPTFKRQIERLEDLKMDAESGLDDFTTMLNAVKSGLDDASLEVAKYCLETADALAERVKVGPAKKLSLALRAFAGALFIAAGLGLAVGTMGTFSPFGALLIYVGASIAATTGVGVVAQRKYQFWKCEMAQLNVEEKLEELKDSQNKGLAQ